MATGNLERAKRCIRIAENIFINGSSLEKNAIINVFLYSVSSDFELHQYNIRQFFPASLHAEYYKQVNTSGI